MATCERPWPLLLSKLRRADPARLMYAEVLAARADPDLLVRERLAEYGGRDSYRPPDCEHGCLPNLDHETRAEAGLVGVACPHEEACWPGWRWVPRDEVLSLRCSSAGVFAALRDENALAPLELPTGSPVTPVGRLQRRGLDVPVVWLRPRRDFELVALGLRRQLGGDGLIVLVPKDPRVPFAAREGIAVLELPARDDGHLELARGLDTLDPTYRVRASERSHPELDVDWIHLRFATEEKRHVLWVNGHDFVGFHKSDAVFARLVLLAASRKFGLRGGWRNKACLVGDFSPRPTGEAIRAADKALEALRKELAADDVPGLTMDEQDAILKAERGTQKVRVSVVPENIQFDESLGRLTWKVPSTTQGKSGAAQLSKRQTEGVELAMLLLAEARRLGVPGEAGDVPPPPLTKRRTRSAA